MVPRALGRQPGEGVDSRGEPGSRMEASACRPEAAGSFVSEGEAAVRQATVSSVHLAYQVRQILSDERTEAKTARLHCGGRQHHGVRMGAGTGRDVPSGACRALSFLPLNDAQTCTNQHTPRLYPLAFPKPWHPIFTCRVTEKRFSRTTRLSSMRLTERLGFRISSHGIGPHTW